MNIIGLEFHIHYNYGSILILSDRELVVTGCALSETTIDQNGLSDLNVRFQFWKYYSITGNPLINGD